LLPELIIVVGCVACSQAVHNQFANTQPVGRIAGRRGPFKSLPLISL
jgi:hypothetical protein